MSKDAISESTSCRCCETRSSKVILVQSACRMSLQSCPMLHLSHMSFCPRQHEKCSKNILHALAGMTQSIRSLAIWVTIIILSLLTSRGGGYNQVSRRLGHYSPLRSALERPPAVVLAQPACRVDIKAILCKISPSYLHLCIGHKCRILCGRTSKASITKYYQCSPCHAGLSLESAPACWPEGQLSILQFCASWASHSASCWPTEKEGSSLA